MRVIHVAIVAGLLFAGAIAAPAAVAEPNGFGRCELKEESYGTITVGPVDEEIAAPTDLECYW